MWVEPFTSILCFATYNSGSLLEALHASVLPKIKLDLVKGGLG